MTKRVKICVGEAETKGRAYLLFDSFGYWRVKFEDGTYLYDPLETPTLTGLSKHYHLNFKTPYTEGQLHAVDEIALHFTNQMISDCAKVSCLNRDFNIFSAIDSDLEALTDKIKKESISRVKLILGIKDETENDSEVESEK